MCGIFGYIGPRDSAKICIKGLKNLEYRGYDSSGIAGVFSGHLLSCKEEGKISVLEEAVLASSLKLDLAIAHTRWATHGMASKKNAHPHFDEKNTVAVVHNGIIENHHVLRDMLMNEGVSFASDTDSEVIAQLISFFYEGDLYTAVKKTIAELEGSFALAIIHKNHTDQIIAVTRSCPLAIAQNKKEKESFLSSDANAFFDDDLEMFYLKDDEIAVVTASEIDVFDKDKNRIIKSLEKLGIRDFTVSKNGFEHFMLKEIHEQPQTVKQAMYNRLKYEYGNVEFENFSLSPQELLGIKRIMILACGSSWHAGSIASSLLENIARIPTQAEIASEFRYKNPIISPDTLVIAISQSGETLDTISAVRETKSKGATVLAICNVPNSTLAREADSCIYLKAGPEISVCSTKAFTSQITVLLLFTLFMARQRNMSKEEGQSLIEKISSLPENVEKVLQKSERIKSFAKKYAHLQSFFFLGRHYMFSTSLEGALKLKEISYLHAMGYPAGELKHGPIALICPDLLTVALCGNEHTYDKLLSNLMEIKARGGPILAFANEGSTQIDAITDDIIYLPKVCDELSPILYSVACQIFAYYIAKDRNTDIDRPRNLAKSVTVE